MSEETKEGLGPVESPDSAKLLGELAALKEKVQMLESVADKAQLAKFYEKTRDKSKRTCRLRCLRDEEGGKVVIIGWGPMVTNEVFINAAGQPVAKQVVKLFTEDGKEVIGDLLDVGRRYEYIQAEKVGETKDNKGNVMWKVKAENGKAYDIDVRFIN